MKLHINLFLFCFVFLEDFGFSQGLTRSSCPSFRLKNGRVRSRQRGFFVQNSCNPGYILAGDKYMKCTKGVWEGALPQCVRPTCKQPLAPTNGYIYVSHRGGVLNFYCKSGYSIVGNPVAYCDGTSWNTHLPVCTNSNKTSVSCDFEPEDICGYTHDLNHNFDWTRHRGSTPSSFIDTGPRYDHTYGVHNNKTDILRGYYMYIEASAKNPNAVARLISPVFPLQDGMCLVFWYHMYGRSQGVLRVYVQPVSNKSWTLDNEYIMWSRVGDHGTRWLRGMVSLATVGKLGDEFQVVFEAVRGSDYRSDTAIDDVSLELCVDVMNDDSTTTTEETTDDGRGYLESWSCYNRCAVSTDNVTTCSCQPDCYENEVCCPDYEAYCLDTPGTTDDTTEMTMTSWNDDSVNVTESVGTSDIDFERTTAVVTTEDDGVDVPIPKSPDPQDVPKLPEIPNVPNKGIPDVVVVLKTTTKLPTTTTRMTTKGLPPRILPAKPDLPSVNPPPKSGIPAAPPAPPVKPAYPTKSTKPTKPTPLVKMPAIKPVQNKMVTPSTRKPVGKQENNPNEVLPNREIKMDVSKITHDVKVEKSAGWPLIGMIVGASLVALVVLLLVVKRRRVATACNSMRMRRGASCDSQSDVRFLTSDEVLDFSIASSNL